MRWLGLLVAAIVPFVSLDAQVPGPEVGKQLLAMQATGQRLYAYDRAAWVTTDALTAAIPKDRMPTNGGWVVEPSDDGALVVTYYTVVDGAARQMFVGTVRDGRVVDSQVVPTGQVRGLTSIERRMVAARDAAAARAVQAGDRPCTPAPFNTVVFPPATPDAPITVYLLSAQVKTGTWPLGGHFRFEVGADGSILSERPFTKTCLNIAEPPPAKGRPVMLVVTHILDPVPTEVHVFTALSAHIPVAVATGKERLWIVDGKQVRLIVPK